MNSEPDSSSDPNTILSVKHDKRIATLEHPPYSPDLAPCKLFLFPKVKGTRFESFDPVKKKWQMC